MKPSDVRIEEVRHDYEEYRYRTPIKFGGVALDRATLVNVEMVVRTRDGRTARGFGSMPLGNVWSFPSRRLSYDQTLGEMNLVNQAVDKRYSLAARIFGISEFRFWKRWSIQEPLR